MYFKTFLNGFLILAPSTSLIRRKLCMYGKYRRARSCSARADLRHVRKDDARDLGFRSRTEKNKSRWPKKHSQIKFQFFSIQGHGESARAWAAASRAPDRFISPWRPITGDLNEPMKKKKKKNEGATCSRPSAFLYPTAMWRKIERRKKKEEEKEKKRKHLTTIKHICPAALCCPLLVPSNTHKLFHHNKTHRQILAALLYTVAYPDHDYLYHNTLFSRIFI